MHKQALHGMKPSHILLTFAILVLAACSTTKPAHSTSTRPDPETVLVDYRVKPGQEAQFEVILNRAWRMYRKEHLVFAAPHVIVKSVDAEGKTRFVEILTWVSHTAPEHVLDEVKSIWDREQSMCEVRNGHKGIEGGEVEIVVGK